MKTFEERVDELLAMLTESDESTWRRVCECYGLRVDTPMPGHQPEGAQQRDPGGRFALDRQRCAGAEARQSLQSRLPDTSPPMPISCSF